MKLTLVRHTSVDVPRGVCYGQSDVGLRSSFPEEAAKVKAALDGRLFDKVFTSPLSRCTRLAEACGYPDAVRDDRLKELDFGEWEMKCYDEITDPRLQEWYADYFNVRATGGESFADQNLRLKSFLNDLLKKPYDNVAIFAHGGILLQAMLISGIITPEQAFDSLPPYGGIVELELVSI